MDSGPRLARLEELLSDVLVRFADSIPIRWARWLAMYYPDSRVRRLFWQKTGVEIGDGSYMNMGVIVCDLYQSRENLLSIGARVSIGPGVIFIADSSPNNSPILRSHPYVAGRLVKREKIVVEDDVWIGAHATIMPGVRLGHACIIGAGAVVIRDVLPYTIVAGVPARELRTLCEIS
jgi:acetyltransferase-like isoleucine patch superfamily enzyme